MDFHNALTGTITLADPRIGRPEPGYAVPASKRSRRPRLAITRVRIIPVDPVILDNCAVLDREEHEELALPLNPFTAVLAALDEWITDQDDCPGLATLLDGIDAAGIGRSFDLIHWLSRWRRA